MRCAEKLSEERAGRRLPLQEQHRFPRPQLRLPRKLPCCRAPCPGRRWPGASSPFWSRARSSPARANSPSRRRTALSAPGFQISQRSDFFSELQSVDTMQRRPIVNTRDEPHANPNLFRRFHVILGDANMSPFSTRLKIGVTALVLEALARDPKRSYSVLADPLAALDRPFRATENSAGKSRWRTKKTPPPSSCSANTGWPPHSCAI